MIRWHEVKFRVIDHAWFAPTDRGEVVVVDCGKGMPPAIDNLVTIVTAESDGTETAGAWRVRGAEQWSGSRYGLTVTKATVEDLEAAKVGLSWKAGHERMPPDRDVWAYIYHYDDDEDVVLLRGRFDVRFREFEPAGTKGSLTTSVLAWVDAGEQPAFCIEAVRACIASLEPLVEDCHDEIAHMAEDWLHREALRAVVAGHPDAQAIAAAALESRKVKFTRYYS